MNNVTVAYGPIQTHTGHEYTVLTCPRSAPKDQPVPGAPGGDWRIAWADHTLCGSFIVYRRTGNLLARPLPVPECLTPVVSSIRTGVSAPLRDPAMEVATHRGSRLKVRGSCEKCGTLTNWVVNAGGRVGAYWCGCD